jgi:hypothetical protein
VRNKMAKTFIKAPTDVIYVAISLLQSWRKRQGASAPNLGHNSGLADEL